MLVEYYTKEEVDSKIPSVDVTKSYVDTQLNLKSDKSDTYTKAEVDTKVSGATVQAIGENNVSVTSTTLTVKIPFHTSAVGGSESEYFGFTLRAMVLV